MAQPLILGADEDRARVICVFSHGRGWTTPDTARVILGRVDAPGTRFILPKSDGPGWYGARAVDPLTDVTRAELTASVAVVADLVRQFDGVPVVLAGFSQGACLSAEYLFQHGPVAAACLFTACRVGTLGDDLPRTHLARMPVYVSGGDADPWIPQAAFHDLLAELTRAGARVRSDLFPGRPHEVTDTETGVLQAMLRRVAAGQSAFDGADHAA